MVKLDANAIMQLYKLVVRSSRNPQGEMESFGLEGLLIIIPFIFGIDSRSVSHRFGPNLSNIKYDQPLSGCLKSSHVQ